MECKTYAYARVSSKSQCLARQIEVLREHVSDERDIITDKASGKDMERQGWLMLKKQLLRVGDTLVIKELDRLSRNMERIKTEWRELTEMGVNIVVVDTPILNTKGKSDLEKSLISNIVFELLAYLAQKQRDKIRSAQEEGIKAAKERGVKFGRSKIEIDDEKLLKLHGEYLKRLRTVASIVQELGVSRKTYYRRLEESKVRLLESQVTIRDFQSE